MNTKQHSGYYSHHDENLQVVGMKGLMDNGFGEASSFLEWESHFLIMFLAFDPTALASSHVSNTHRTKLSSEPSNPQCLPETLLTIPCFIPFSKQMASLAPSILPHLLSVSVCLPLELHNQYFSRRIALDFPLWWTSLVAQMVKNLPTMQEIQVWFLGQEDLPEKEMATYSSTRAWRIPRTEKPSGL